MQKYIYNQQSLFIVSDLDEYFLGSFGLDIQIMKVLVKLNKYYKELVSKYFSVIFNNEILNIKEQIQNCLDFLVPSCHDNVITKINYNDITNDLIFWYACRYSPPIFCKFFFNKHPNININQKATDSLDKNKYATCSNNFNMHPFLNALFGNRIFVCEWFLSLPGFSLSKKNKVRILFWMRDAQNQNTISNNYNYNLTLEDHLLLVKNIQNLDNKYNLGIGKWRSRK